MPIKLSREEQETIIRCSAADDEWDICTADPKIIRKLIKLGYPRGERYQDPEGYQSFRCPVGKIAFRRLEKRKISQATKDNLQKARNFLKSPDISEKLQNDAEN